MAELVPAPFADLIHRMRYELARQDAIFDLPRRKWWVPEPGGADLSVTFHGERAGTPVGPAAGPHTQMAQNLVLSWLAGGRILELKTVQINDRLKIARPCIDITNIGYNIEWSQELRIVEALREYVAGAMLIHMLIHGDILPESPLKTIATETIYDLSVGYDLAGIRSAPVRTFIEQMKDARAMVERLRGEIPVEYRRLRDLEYPTRLSSSITLSTFHGCPAAEIERICEFLLTEMDCDVIIKMNPPMLGKDRLEHLLHDVMGYRDLTVNPHAYTSGLQFDESLEIVDRLSRLAVSRGRKLGAKFSNTLEVENHRDFFTPDNKIMYLSGQPLHVITLTLADVFRHAVGPEVPLTFSAGVDRQNFANMVACGFRPISTSTDLLRPGGYGRLPAYLTTLAAEMRKVGAATIDEYIVDYDSHRGGRGGTQRGEMDTHPAASASSAVKSGPLGVIAQTTPWASPVVTQAAAENLRRIVPETQKDTRYYAAANAKAPKRIDSHLVTFDCITCDKCIPVCPNDANFYYQAEPETLEFTDWIVKGADLVPGDAKKIVVEKTEQIANFSDFCNDCGNCDTFCPEYGGPFIKKPNFFGTYASWQASHRDGFFIDAERPVPSILGRIMGKSYLLEAEPQWKGYRFEDGTVCLFLHAATHQVERWFAFGPRDATGHVADMEAYHTLRILLKSLTRLERVNQVNVKLAARNGT